MKKALAKIAVSGATTLMVIILIVVGIQIFASCKNEPILDLMTAEESSSPTVVAGTTTSGYRQNASPAAECTSVPSPSYSNSSPSTAPGKSTSVYSGNTIGLSTGGAKDIINFRENIENNYLPLPTDVTYEGLFYDYYFDTGISRPCDKLFCPSYASAVTATDNL
jgi:hypothetical protein